MKRILVLGDMNSVWLFRYIKKMHSVNMDITVVDMSLERLKRGAEYYEFCEKMGINIISIYNNVSYARCLEYVALINRMENFDVCHVMFVSVEASLIVRLCANKFKQVVANFWGSDYYRTTLKVEYEQKFLLDIADTVIVPAKKMEAGVAEKYSIVKDKIHTVYFQSPKMEILIEQTQNISTDTYFNISQDKIVVAVGYNGFKEQQHEMLLEAINHCEKEIREKLFVVIMMSYGLTPEYEKHIMNVIKDLKVECLVIKDFLSDSQVVELRKRVDIYINGRTTDSFNAALRESMYCQSVILNGAWLKYPELEERNAEIIEFSGPQDLTQKVESIVDYISEYKEKAKKNRKVMVEVLESFKNVENWDCFYKDVSNREIVQDNDDEVWQYTMNEASIQLERKKQYDEIHSNWLAKRIDGISPVQQFVEKSGYKNIVIYGAGTLGELVYKELKTLNLNINICDQNENIVEWFDGQIIQPNRLSTMIFDCVLVTPVHVYDVIVKSLGLEEDMRIVSLTQIMSE